MFEKPRLSNDSFVILHFADKVRYDLPCIFVLYMQYDVFFVFLRWNTNVKVSLRKTETLFMKSWSTSCAIVR